MNAILNRELVILLFPLFFLVFFIFSMGVVLMLRKRAKTRALVKKIQESGFRDASTLQQDRSQKRPLPGKKEKKNPMVSFLSLFSGKGRKHDPELPDPGTMRLKFLQAGIKTENIEAAFFGAKLFLPVLLVSVFLILKFTGTIVVSNPMTIAGIVLLGLIGFYLPDIWLMQKTQKRKVGLFKALPDALDLLVVCVEAGMGLDAALLKVGQEIEDTYPDLSREFAYLNLEMRAGKQRSEALKNLYLRTGIDEMNSLVTLLIQTDKFGTSISNALQVFSESFRTKRYQMAEEMAAKLPVKILIPLILFIFPALFVVILGPAAITIYKNIILKGL
jgi:tight adherence protein C